MSKPTGIKGVVFGELDQELPGGLKRCKCCKAIKPMVWFKQGHGDDGRHAFCTKCIKRLKRAQELKCEHYFGEYYGDCSICEV